MSNIFMLLFHAFILIFALVTIFFGGIAIIVYLYSLITHKSFRVIFPNAVEKCVGWLLNLFKSQINGSQQLIYKMDRTYIEPISKILCENDCPCVERNAYIMSSVSHYEFQLSDKVKHLDLSYLEKLLQAAYYNDILPLYQNQVGQIRKEDIDVFITQHEKFLGIYIGHCQIAYAKINEYRKIEQQRKLENFNNMCKEMIE